MIIEQNGIVINTENIYYLYKIDVNNGYILLEDKKKGELRPYMLYFNSTYLNFKDKHERDSLYNAIYSSIKLNE